MALFDFLSENRINESIKAFVGKGQSKISDENLLDRTGEGITDVFSYANGFSKHGLNGFFDFYNSYLNRLYESEVAKINNYRLMSEHSEISDVIEDACNEAITEFDTGETIKLVINNDKLTKNMNIVNNIYKEFNELFENRIDISSKIWDMFRTYLIDGRVYYERIIKKSNPRAGIYNIKKLPSETMDYEYNPILNKITRFYQYIGKNIRRPSSLREASTREDIIIFEPEQIGYIDYGIYGKTRQEVMGFLEKAKVAYNQLKLMETSVIIYRLVRAPERFVFKIDTGQMPKDKAIKFVEKVKQRFVKKVTYNTNTGEISNSPEIMCLKNDTKIPLADGRVLELKQIVDEYKQGKKNNIVTINQATLEKEEKPIIDAKITRLNSPLVRVHLERGYVDCTPDHKFLVWFDDTKTKIIEVEAQHLTEDMDIVDAC